MQRSPERNHEPRRGCHNGFDRLFNLLSFISLFVLLSPPAIAQNRIVPDGTLAGEQSITTLDTIRGLASDRISGGARQGANLFHSFSQFDIGANRGAYFENPTGVANILTRVTGGVRSEILGTLGVLGDANLFLMNPNGIIFGPGARLDVRGSFVGTTANAIGFGDRGVFSATSSTPPSSLLTINPSAFFFNQVLAGSIINNSIAPSGTSPAGLDVLGLRVPDGQSLFLVGGDINMDGGRLNAFGGRIELGGLAAAGIVGVEQTGNLFHLNFPTNVTRSNLTLANDARVAVRGGGGGEIVVNANTITATNGGRLVAGVETIGNGGNLAVNADEIHLSGVGTSSNESGFYQEVLANANGNAGDIIVNTRSLNLFDGAAIGNRLRPNGAGSAGNVLINTNSFTMTGNTTRLNVSTLGRGDAGNLILNVGNTASLANRAIIASNVASTGRGNGGEINIVARSLSLTNGAELQAGILPGGQGRSGRVNINVQDALTIAGENLNSRGGASGIFTDAETGTVGRAGDINIVAGSVSLSDGGVLVANTAGRGDAGNISIQANGQAELRGARISSSVQGGAEGNGGLINITANSLSLIDARSLITTSTLGRGNAGNITIQSEGIVNLDAGGITSITIPGAIGNGGNISLTAGSLTMLGDASISSAASGQGNAGTITIRTEGAVTVRGGGILSGVQLGGIGNGGDITLTADSLTMVGRSLLSNSVDGRGDSGNIFIRVNDAIKLDGVGIASNSNNPALINSSDPPEPQGNAGNITIRAGSLSLINQASVSSATLGRSAGGNSGSISIRLDDNLSLANQSFIYSSVLLPNDIGNAGQISITADSARVSNNSQISSSIAGKGNGGDILIQTSGNITFVSSGVYTIVNSNAEGQGGNLTIRANSLLLSHGAALNASTYGKGDAGNINIVLADDLEIRGAARGLNRFPSDISSQVGSGGSGDAGDITIRARFLSLSDGAQIGASLFRQYQDQQGNNFPSGQGRGGSIRLNIADSIRLSGISSTGFSSGILALTDRGTVGPAGSITIHTGDLRVENGAIVIASTSNEDPGGNIFIDADNLEVVNGGQIVTSTRSSGNAGRISLNITGNTTITGVDPSFRERQERVQAYLQSPLGRQSERASDVIRNQGSASGIFANTETNSSGNGGTINLNTANLNLSNGARISTQSQGLDIAGNITIDAQSVQLDHHARISAETSSENGGNITLNADDALVLRDRSSISSTAGTARAGGNGGNITIEAESIVAVPSENSNIRANAFQGNGGSVNLSANLYGITVADRETTASEITATSDRGVQGEINVTSPDVNPVQGLIALPSETLDASNQIAAVCPQGRNANEELGRFVITGRGGLPDNPTENLDAEAVFTQWINPPTERQAPSDRPSSSVLHSPFTIVEAQHWVRGADGKITLVAAVPQPGDRLAGAIDCPASLN